MGIDAEMFVRTTYKPTDAELREWHYRLGCAFHEHLWAFGTHENRVPDDLYIFPVDVWEQDGPDIIPKNGETFLRVRPVSRYYGPGYERGDFPMLKALAEFLELLVPESEVWYGGDSSGVLAAKFGPIERECLLHHWAENQGRPYYDRNLWGDGRRPVCPYCQVTCPQFGTGHSYGSWECLGCGWRRIERDGETYEGWELDVDGFGHKKEKARQ